MFEKKLYVCEYCNTPYRSEEKAKECEENHRIGMKIIWADYVAMKSDETGMPKPFVFSFKMAQQGYIQSVDYKRQNNDFIGAVS